MSTMIIEAMINEVIIFNLPFVADYFHNALQHNVLNPVNQYMDLSLLRNFLWCEFIAFSNIDNAGIDRATEKNSPRINKYQ